MIELLDTITGLEPGDSGVYGHITIDDFDERFYASTTYWSKNEYAKQWVSAIEDIINGPEKNDNALVACMYDPLHANFIVCWTLYRENNVVFVQNQNLFLNEIPEKFNIKRLDEYIGKRRIVTKDGDEISEWVTDLESLQDCLYELRRAT